MMADQNLDREYANIKAGVEGIIDDVPSPSEDISANATNEIDAPNMDTNEASTDDSSPETSYTETNSPNYEEATDYGSTNNSQPAIDPTRLHEIVESVVSEKFADLTSNLGDLAAWKEKINHDVVSIKQEILRTVERFENLQNAILGRVKEYDKGITNVHTEMKALEKVLERILEPLVMNIKELSKITEDMKKGKK